MSSLPSPPCTHELGPGISVCLRCRQEQRQLAQARQRRMLTKGGILLGGIVVLAVAGNAVSSAVRSSATSRNRAPLQLLASTTLNTVQQQGVPSRIPSREAARAPLHAKVATAAPSGLTLKIPVGRTGLRDSMYVERVADSVVVHFDTELARTRRRDKFEATVRATLPMLYGAAVDSMLTGLPEGAITGGRDLVSEVAVRGVRLPAPAGGTLELWPVTRPGRDGPLVVGYRARVIP